MVVYIHFIYNPIGFKYFKPEWTIGAYYLGRTVNSSDKSHTNVKIVSVFKKHVDNEVQWDSAPV